MFIPSAARSMKSQRKSAQGASASNTALCIEPTPTTWRSLSAAPSAAGALRTRRTRSALRSTNALLPPSVCGRQPAPVSHAVANNSQRYGLSNTAWRNGAQRAMGCDVRGAMQRNAARHSAARRRTTPPFEGKLCGPKCMLPQMERDKNSIALTPSAAAVCVWHTHASICPALALKERVTCQPLTPAGGCGLPGRTSRLR
mmetsp:Transcript_136067/g.352810  ORF Transcript_136067/g.352810 Transcript_136067/m.352810 type:complete len:200 (-) Transcript_136067:758-1357(-)